MKIFETTASLGYQQKAYIVRLNQTENGYDYLCVGGENLRADDYEVGNVVKDLEDFYIEDSLFMITESPLYGTFLFDWFVKNYYT